MVIQNTDEMNNVQELEDIRKALFVVIDAFRNYLQATIYLTEGIKKNGIDLSPMIKRRLIRAMRDFYECLLQFSEQYFLKEDPSYMASLLDLKTLIKSLVYNQTSVIISQQQETFNLVEKEHFEPAAQNSDSSTETFHIPSPPMFSKLVSNLVGNKSVRKNTVHTKIGSVKKKITI
jgi:hypothetical protein